MHCRSCGTPVLIHDLTPIKLSALKDFVRVVELRYRAHPGQNILKIMREEVSLIERLIVADDELRVRVRR